MYQRYCRYSYPPSGHNGYISILQNENQDDAMPSLFRVIINNSEILIDDVIENTDINITYEGKSALHHAARLQRFNFIETLINAGIDTTIIDHDGKTARDLLLSYNDQIKFDMLIENLHSHNIQMRTNAIVEMEILPIDLCFLIATMEGGSGAYIEDSHSCCDHCIIL